MALTEARKAYLAEWRERRREHLRSYHTAWRRSHGAEPRSEMRHGTFYAYNQGCRCDPCVERTREQTRKWRAANPERVRAREAEYRRKGKTQAKNRDYRAKKAGNGGFTTREQVMARVAYYGDRCWVCRGSWDSIDHVKPVSKGGPNWASNLRPICRSCNARKSNRFPYLPLKEVKRPLFTLVLSA